MVKELAELRNKREAPRALEPEALRLVPSPAPQSNEPPLSAQLAEGLRQLNEIAAKLGGQL